MPDTFQETNGYLLTQVAKLFRAFANHELETVGMYKGQDMILCELNEQDGLTQSELVERLLVQPATMTNALNSMEKAGLVRRQPDPADQRISRVYITAQARALQPQMQHVWDNIEAETFAHLSADERILLRRLLMQVYENLRIRGKK